MATIAVRACLNYKYESRVRQQLDAEQPKFRMARESARIATRTSRLSLGAGTGPAIADSGGERCRRVGPRSFREVRNAPPVVPAFAMGVVEVFHTVSGNGKNLDHLLGVVVPGIPR